MKYILFFYDDYFYFRILCVDLGAFIFLIIYQIDCFGFKGGLFILH